MNLPYFKRQIIIAQLIEELAEEGSKRPTDIKALKHYGSKQDQYSLLNNLVEKRILEKRIFSHKHKEYRLTLDEKVTNLIRDIKKAWQQDIKELEKVSKLKLSNREATLHCVSTFLFQLVRVFQAIQVIAYYEFYDPETRHILTFFLHKEIDHVLHILNILKEEYPEATGQALKLTSKILIENATRYT